MDTPTKRRRSKDFPHHVSAVLTDELYQMLDTLTRRRSITQSAVIRMAIRALYQLENGKPQRFS